MTPGRFGPRAARGGGPDNRPLEPREERLRCRFGLTRMEAVVAAMLGEGLSYAEVAARRQVSYHTVHSHVKAIHEKSGVHSTARLLALIHAGNGTTGP
jgi:DNA-binding CsgD family transcriptional regulator